MDILSITSVISTEILDTNLLDFILRFSLNLFTTIMIVNFIYFKTTGKRSYVFTFIMISTTVFFLCFLLGSIDLQLGFALGLFAIFGIIRYRTDPIPIREMTYLFLIITISVVNALANSDNASGKMLFTNFALLTTTLLMEKVWMKRHLARRTIIYDRIDLIHPSKAQELKTDIMERAGIKIEKFKIGQIDFYKKNVRLTIFYKEENSPHILSDPEMSGDK